MNDRRNGSIRWLLSATLIALPLISVAAEPDTCAVSANPSRFDHKRVTLEGIVTGLMKSTARSGSKQMTFLLSSLAGCGGVIVFFQGPATLSNGDHLQVEGIFAIEHRRDGSTFHNQIHATKITVLPQ
ncbi:MAG: hypothetical protein C5B58_07895 [Acidobacteria bacterium]|nr:MAG: hypothetical protein C5B58_07895 [Acidobacteriota bacterium]